MSDLISRQAALDACHNYEDRKDAYAYGFIVEERLQALPSAQPDRKTGQWIKRKKGAIGYNCSCCGKSDISNHFDYCPNCGAMMERRKDVKDAVGN